MLISLDVAHTRRVSAASLAVTIEIALPQHQVTFATLLADPPTAVPHPLLCQVRRSCSSVVLRLTSRGHHLSFLMFQGK